MNSSLEITLPGISCINCVKPLQNHLEQHKDPLNIQAFFIDVSDKTLHLSLKNSNQATVKKITDTIDEYGIEWRLVEDMPPPAKPSASHRLQGYISSHWVMAGVGLISGIGLIILSVSGLVLPFALMLGLNLTAMITMMAIGAPSFYQAWKNFNHHYTLTMDTLFTLSSLAILGVSIAAFFIPGLPILFEAGLMIFGFRHLGQAIESSLIAGASGPKRFSDRLPARVSKEVDGQSFNIRIDSLSVGDVLQLKAGEVIPVDCELLSPDGSILDTLKSGSTIPKKMSQGDFLSSGFVVDNDSPEIQVTVLRTKSESFLSQMDKQLIASQSDKAPIEHFTDRILQYFIPSVLLIALGAGLILPFFYPLTLAIKCAIAVLVSACPCTLGLIVPLGVKVGVKKGLEYGVSFKNPESLERASQINCIVFDLTGSLTEANPKVSAFYQFDRKLSALQCKMLTLIAEQSSQHPIARALMHFCKNDVKESIPDQQTPPKLLRGGVQVEAMFEGEIKEIVLGNRHCMESLGYKLPASMPEIALGQHTVYLAVNKTVTAMYTLKDPLREQVACTIEKLKQSGHEVHICTGADQQTALGYAQLAGVPSSHIAANCIPIPDGSNARTKSSYIRALQKRGKRVAMVGDAGNDSLALLDSDFGIAMHSSASDQMTKDSASAIINRGNLLPILHCFDIARQSMGNIKQNLYLSVGYNSLNLMLSSIVLIAFGLAINPALGAGLMVLQTSLILANVYRFTTQKSAHTSMERPTANLQKENLFRLGVPHEISTEPVVQTHTKAHFYSKAPIILPEANPNAACTTMLHN